MRHLRSILPQIQLSEIKFEADYRTNKDSPFYVSYKQQRINPDYKYDAATNTKTGGDMYIPYHHFSFHDTGYNSGVYSKKLDYKHPERDGYAEHKGVIIDPKNKTVNFNLQSIHSHNKRRSNQKIGEHSPNGGYRQTPIVYGGMSELSDLDHHKLLKDIHKIHPIHDYKVIGDPRHEGKTVKEVLNGFHDIYHAYIHGKPITVYHGTSAKRAKEILQHGLKSGQRKEDYVDQVKGYSHYAHLTTRPDEASNYATREGIHDGSSPTILKTTIHPKDFHHIMRDADNIHHLHPVEEARLKKKYPHLFNKPEDEEEKTRYWSPQVGFHQVTRGAVDVKTGKKIPHRWRKDELVDEYVKREIDFRNPRYTGHLNPKDIPAEHDENSYRDHLGREIRDAHVRRNTMNFNKASAFAYKGHIKPQHIEVFRRWNTKSTKKDPDDDEFNTALDVMQKSIKTKL